MTDETVGIGHNQSPFEAQQQRVNDLVENANRWVKERPEIEDDEQAKAAQDFIVQLRTCHKDVEATRKTEKQPFLDQAADVDKQFNPLKALLDVAAGLMKRKLTPWLQKKQREAEAEQERQEAAARKQREEAEAARLKAEEAAKTGDDAIQAQVVAEDLAKEAAKAEKAASAPVKASVKGSMGRAASLRTTYTGEIEDFDKCLAHFKNHPGILQELRGLVNSAVRGGNHNIPGVKIIRHENV